MNDLKTRPDNDTSSGDRPEPPAERTAVYWFTLLILALGRGAFADASHAANGLRRCGVRVLFDTTSRDAGEAEGGEEVEDAH